MTHLFNPELEDIQKNLSNHIWQEINFFHKADCSGHAAIAQLI